MLKTYWHMLLKRDSLRGRADAPSGIRITPLAKQGERETVAALYGTAFRDLPWPSEWAQFAGFDPAGVFIAYDDAQAVGFVVSYIRPDSSEEGYISVVGTASSHRRRGIATALIHRAASRFWELGYRRVAVDVAADNLAARDLYRQVGFCKVGEFMADEHCRRASPGV